MATAKIVLSKISASSTITTYTVKYNLVYYGNGVSYNKGACKYTISATGQNAKTGSHSFSKATGAQLIGTATFKWDKSTSATTKTISASFVTGASLGTLKTSVTITVPALPTYNISFRTNKYETNFNNLINDELFPIKNMPNSTTVVHGSTYTLPEVSRNKYKLKFWSVDGRMVQPLSTITITKNTIIEAFWEVLPVTLQLPEKDLDEPLGVIYSLSNCYSGSNLNKNIHQYLTNFVETFDNNNPLSELIVDSTGEYFTIRITLESGRAIELQRANFSNIIDNIFFPKTSNICFFDIDYLYTYVEPNSSIVHIEIHVFTDYKKYDVTIEDANSNVFSSVCSSNERISTLFFKTSINDAFTDENGFTYLLNKSVVQDLSKGRADIAPFNDFGNSSNNLIEGFISADNYVRNNLILKACYTKQPQFSTTFSNINYKRLNLDDYNEFIRNDFNYDNFDNFKLDNHNDYICGYIQFNNEYDSNYVLRTYYADYVSTQSDNVLSGKYNITVDDIDLEISQQFIDSNIFIKFYCTAPILSNIERILNISLTELKTKTDYHLDDIIEHFTLPSSHTLLHINNNRTKINLGYEYNGDNTDYEINTTIPINFFNNKNNIIYSNSILNIDTLLTDLIPGTYYIGDNLNIVFYETKFPLNKGDIISVNVINDNDNTYYILKTDLINGKTIFRVINL